MTAALDDVLAEYERRLDAGTSLGAGWRLYLLRGTFDWTEATAGRLALAGAAWMATFRHDSGLSCYATGATAASACGLAVREAMRMWPAAGGGPHTP